MADPLRHRQTKGAATDMVDLTPPRHIPTLPHRNRIRRRQCHREIGERAVVARYRTAVVGHRRNIGADRREAPTGDPAGTEHADRLRRRWRRIDDPEVAAAVKLQYHK